MQILLGGHNMEMMQIIEQYDSLTLGSMFYSLNLNYSTVLLHPAQTFSWPPICSLIH
jgi:hypothetical protein